MGQIAINDRKDILLLLLYSPGKLETVNEPIAGRTRLIKSIFLFNKERWSKFKENIKMEDSDLYQFTPWNYGPFSKQVYDDLTFFILRDFISAKPSSDEMIVEEAEETDFWRSSTGSEDSITEYQEELFKLTPKGEKFATKLFELLTPNQKNMMKLFKASMQETPLRALLRYVYSQYPNEISNSLIVKEVLGTTN